MKTVTTLLLSFLFVALPAMAENTAATAHETPLIPRQKLFGQGERMRVRLSPDGKYVAWVAPVKNEQGIPVSVGIFRAPVDNKDKVETVLADGNPRIPQYFFSLRSDKMFFLRDVGGNENEQLHVIDLNTGKVENLTNNNDVKTHFLGQNLEHPSKVLYSMNNRDPQYSDVYEYDMDTGKSTMLFKNDQSFFGTMEDEDGVTRIGIKYDEKGDLDYFIKRGEKWELLLKLGMDDATTTSVVGADFKSGLLFLTDSRGQDKAALKSMDLKTGELKTLASTDKADIEGVITTFDGRTPLAAEYNFTRKELIGLQPGMDQEMAKLHALFNGDIQVMSKTADDKKWLVAFFSDTKSVRYYLWDRVAQKGELMFVMQPDLDKLPLVKMHPVVIKSRDGLDMVSYLTLPPGVNFNPKTLRPEKPLPLILVVHGGPWARDEWGMNPEHQWLANRGYAVLSVNYRGSTGFGKSYISASFGQWGGKMHDDLIDAVKHMIDTGVTQKDKVAIMGASYGGYAALVGATFTPDTFVAAVDIVGPANLITSEESNPPYWKPFKTNQVRRMGADVDTEEGKAFLWSRSPLAKADQIKVPLLVGQGDNDPRVKLAESLQIVDAMKKKGLPVTLIRFPDEGHGFQRPANNQSFYAACEIFLQQHLHGRAEALSLIPGTTMSVPEGAELIPGLPEALKQVPKTSAKN
jgi:dipeptidyl aminopeptidase/acylaminoacyl peptidase